ncbi:MAG: PAS domain-containing sensor histidine kinase [Fusobacteriaceae bacterium]
MESNIYKEMIEDSPIAYIHMKIIEDEIENHVSLEVKNYNKAYERIFLIDLGMNMDDINKMPENKEILYKWMTFFNKVKQNKKCTIEKYLDHAKSYFNIEVFYGENNEYHIRLTKISNQHRKLSLVFRNAPFYAWIKDRNGVYLDANQVYLNFLGKTYDEVIGKTSFDLLETERAEYIHKEEEKIMQQNKLFIYDDTIIKPEKLKGHYEVFKWPYMNEDESTTLGTFGICIDVTEKVNLRKKLEATEKKFLEIANNINDIIIIRDEKKAHYINPAFEKIYKIKPDALYEDINKLYEYWDEVEFENEPHTYTYDKADTCTFRVSKKGQEDMWFWNRFVPIFDEKGNITKKIGILSDVTEVKKMQLEIDKIKMDFFANISHELRTPIHLILSTLQVLYLKIGKLDGETLEYFDRYINIIGQNGRRLLKLVNNLIDTTRLDAGCFNYSPKNNDIISCVEDVCTSISTYVNTNNLNLIFDTDKEEKIVSFDQDNMERIILNLVSNAIKFNKPNGKIEVTISCKDNIKISIKDTGIGIPKDKLDSIFERFVQVKTKFKKEREGSGIGLSLVKLLVEMHGGTIIAKSKLGEGSEFVITLPDILLKNEDENIIETQPLYLSSTNRLNVEFSDIYF